MNKITYRICLHLGEISEKNHLLPTELLKWLCSLIRMVLGDYNHLKVVSVQNHLFQNKWAFHFLGLSAEVGRPCFYAYQALKGCNVVIIITANLLWIVNDHHILCLNDNDYTLYSYLSALVTTDKCLPQTFSGGMMVYGGV